MKKVLEYLSAFTASIALLAMTISGTVVFVWCAIGETCPAPGPQWLATVAGFVLYATGLLSMFALSVRPVWKFAVRTTAGTFFAIVAVTVAILCIVTLMSGTHGVLAFFGAIFFIVLSILIGQLAAFCFSEKYAKAIGDRDIRDLGQA